MIKKRFGNLQVTGIREFALSEKKEVKRALEMVAQEYQISDNPQDYVVGVVKAVQIDYPNDNGDNMPWEEVVKIKSNLGLMAYQTFILKPHFIEHVSDDPKKAKGCILDAHLVDSEGNTIGSKDEDKEMYVEVVLAVDKRKDPLNPIVWVPFEINPSFKIGDRVLAVGEEGEFLGDFEVVDIKNFTAEKTKVIGIKATNEVCDKISSIKILDEENFLKYSNNISNMSDDVIVCRCERVSLGEIRKWIRKGVRDLNQLKALTRLGMGACGSKTCGQLIYSVLRSEGVDFKEVRDLTKRPLFVEVEFQSFCVSGDDDKKKADNFSNF